MPYSAAATVRCRTGFFFSLRTLCGAAGLAIAILSARAWGQAKPAPKPQDSHQMVVINPNSPPQADWIQELDKKYPGLLAEFANLQARLQKEIQLPGPRLQSKLLPLLPDSTIFYVAIPNYGDSVHQALQIVDQELKESNVLRDWFQHSDISSSWPKVELALDKGYELSEYLGDEVVISASMNGKEPALLVLAEARKPGIKALIPQMEKLVDEKATPLWRVVDPQELMALKNTLVGPVVLVRSDIVALGSDVATLRNFNNQSQATNGKFVATELGDRLVQGYHDGAVLLSGVDLQKLISEIPLKSAEERAVFDSLGIGDMKFATWKHSQGTGQAASEAELSFSGPRRGIASWLGAAAPLQSLELTSPKAAVVMALRLKNPAEIYDDIKEIANSANPKSMAMLSQMEQGLGISLQQDLLGKLSGEFTVESDAPAGQDPSWKLILGVTDASALQQTLNGLLSRAGVPVQHNEQGGVTLYSVAVPNGPKRTMIHYAFSGGFLLVSSTPSLITDALQLRSSGNSLARSREFIDSLPHGHSAIASGVVYQNFGIMMASTMKQLSPDAARLFAGMRNVSSPVTMCLYGEDRAIKEISTGGNMDIAAVTMIAAAIAVPNMLRAKVSANEAGAGSMLRTVNTAQVTYAATYPGRRFAPDLATLGPGTGACKESEISPNHACLLDATLGGPSCTRGVWCTRNGYRFSIAGTCRGLTCSDYVAVATPANLNSGTKNFCSASDAVIRSKPGPPLSTAITPAECRTWAPLR